MFLAVKNSLRLLTHDDRMAIATYLMDIDGNAPSKGDAVVAAMGEKAHENRSGQALYLSNCSLCHGPDAGRESTMPPLAGNATLAQPDGVNLMNDGPRNRSAEDVSDAGLWSDAGVSEPAVGRPDGRSRQLRTVGFRGQRKRPSESQRGGCESEPAISLRISRATLPMAGLLLAPPVEPLEPTRFGTHLLRRAMAVLSTGGRSKSCPTSAQSLEDRQHVRLPGHRGR